MTGVSDPKPKPLEPSGIRPRSNANPAGSGFARRGWIPATTPEYHQQLWGLLTIAPALFLILALTLYPVAYSLWLSLLEKHSFFPQQKFIGLENYFYLWKDAEFWIQPLAGDGLFRVDDPIPGDPGGGGRPHSE